MADPIEETEYRRKKSRAKQYQAHLDQTTAQEPEQIGTMQSGKKVKKLPELSTPITDVFKQSIQQLPQVDDGKKS